VANPEPGPPPPEFFDPVRKRTGHSQAPSRTCSQRGRVCFWCAPPLTHTHRTGPRLQLCWDTACVHCMRPLQQLAAADLLPLHATAVVQPPPGDQHATPPTRRHGTLPPYASFHCIATLAVVCPHPWASPANSPPQLSEQQVRLALLAEVRGVAKHGSEHTKSARVGWAAVAGGAALLLGLCPGQGDDPHALCGLIRLPRKLPHPCTPSYAPRSLAVFPEHAVGVRGGEARARGLGERAVRWPLLLGNSLPCSSVVSPLPPAWLVRARNLYGTTKRGVENRAFLRSVMTGGCPPVSAAATAQVSQTARFRWDVPFLQANPLWDPWLGPRRRPGRSRSPPSSCLW
jgi:hypothetical protein